MKERPTSFLGRVIVEWRKDRHFAAEQAERTAIAKAFNDRYTYRKRFDESNNEPLYGSATAIFSRRGHAWMCPDCNKIHMAFEVSVFDGLHYPPCCRYPEGNRLSYGIRMK